MVGVWLQWWLGGIVTQISRVGWVVVGVSV